MSAAASEKTIRAFALDQSRSNFHDISKLDPEGKIRFYTHDGQIDIDKGLELTLDCFMNNVKYPPSTPGNDRTILEATSAKRLRLRGKLVGLDIQNPNLQVESCDKTSGGIDMVEFALQLPKYDKLVCAYLLGAKDKIGRGYLLQMRNNNTVRDYLNGNMDSIHSFRIWVDGMNPDNLSEETYKLYKEYSCLKDAVEADKENERCSKPDVKLLNDVKDDRNITVVGYGKGSLVAAHADGCYVVNSFGGK